MFKEKFYKAVLNICMFFYLAFIDEYLAFKGFSDLYLSLGVGKIMTLGLRDLGAIHFDVKN